MSCLERAKPKLLTIFLSDQTKALGSDFDIYRVPLLLKLVFCFYIKLI